MLASKYGVPSKLVKMKLFVLDQSSSPVKWGKYYHTVKLIKKCNRITDFWKRQKKIFFFCTEYGCSGMFSSQLHLDQATDQQVRTTWNIHLQKRLSSRHISLLTQVVLTQLLQMKKVLHQHQLWCHWKKKVGQSPNGKNSVIQKHRKTFWWNTLKRENKLVLKNTNQMVPFSTFFYFAG